MTVSIAVVSADGIAIAADSRTTLQLAGPTRVLSDFTHKVFQVGPFGVATYGWAFLEGRNIAGHMTEFDASLAKDATVDLKDLAERLAVFFGDLMDRHLAAGLDAAPPPDTIALGFLVAGYEDGVGRVYEVELPLRKVVQHLDSATNPGAAWRGQTDVIVRLIKGADRGLLDAFAHADGKGVELDALQETLDKLEYVIPFQAMSLQDAVDFAVFAIRTTIDTQRLTHGTQGAVGSWPGVGGPIEVGVVHPREGFKWLQQTRLQAERRAGEAERI